MTNIIFSIFKPYLLVLVDNVGGATIETNFNHTYSGFVCDQYLRNMFSSF